MKTEDIIKMGQAFQQVQEKKKKLDPVDKDELKGTHADRDDKDIERNESLMAIWILYTEKHPIEIQFLKVSVTRRNTIYFVMGFAFSRIVSLFVSYLY